MTSGVGSAAGAGAPTPPAISTPATRPPSFPTPGSVKSELEEKSPTTLQKAKQYGLIAAKFLGMALLSISTSIAYMAFPLVILGALALDGSKAVTEALVSSAKTKHFTMPHPDWFLYNFVISHTAPFLAITSEELAAE